MPNHSGAVDLAKLLVSSESSIGAQVNANWRTLAVDLGEGRWRPQGLDIKTPWAFHRIDGQSPYPIC
jgi:hypothetical protein